MNPNNDNDAHLADYTQIRMGRFTIEIPSYLIKRHQENEIRFCTVEEKSWQNKSDWMDEYDTIFKQRVSEVQEMTPPRGISNSLIDTINVSGHDNFFKAILYYGDIYIDDELYIDAFYSSGPAGLWLKISGIMKAKESMLDLIRDIASAYRTPGKASDIHNEFQGGFYLDYGVIELPYLDQERIRLNFVSEDQNLELSIDIQTVYKLQEAGLMDKLNAAVATDFGLGLKVETIRAQKRRLAGLDGEELIISPKDDKQNRISFSWEYLGQVNSGIYPEIMISMDTEKMGIDSLITTWDNILNSLKRLD